MVIRKIPVISWLLTDNKKDYLNKINIALSDIQSNNIYLKESYDSLVEVRNANPLWGIPEYIMPSFDKAIQKSSKAFQKIWAELFKELSEKEECGIVISPQWGGTIIYGFEDDILYIWFFRNMPDKSVLYAYFTAKINRNNLIEISCPFNFLYDTSLFAPNNEGQDFCSSLAHYLTVYLSLKKYAPVETIIVAKKSITKIDDSVNEHKQKEKIKNDSGQEVIVMDSKWFTKIINDNDIFVRGFFRLQNKKNDQGEWYKELIYVDSFVRHGYHRNAKIDDNDGL